MYQNTQAINKDLSKMNTNDINEKKSSLLLNDDSKAGCINDVSEGNFIVLEDYVLHCGTNTSTQVYRIKDTFKFKCGNKKTCDKKFNVLVGTVFHGTKIPLSTWFAAIYLATAHKKGISSCQLARDLGIQQRSAWHLLHRIRQMIAPQTNIELNETVQIDETYVKGEAKNRDKYTRKLIAEGKKEDKSNIVLGIVNNEMAVFKVVPDAERDTIKPIIKAVVTDKETVIVTDGFPSYNGLELIYKGRIVINHAQQEYKVVEYHTNTVEGAFSLFKRCIYGTYHWVSERHLHRYCTLFAYGYNTRKLKEPSRFDNVFENTKGRLPYKQLIAPTRIEFLP